MSTRAELLLSAAMAYNRVAEQYDKNFHSNVALAEDDVIYGMLRKWLRPGWTLDLGCGTGQFLDHISLGKMDYWGVDVAEKMIEIARAKFHDYQFGCVDMETALRLTMPSSVSNVISLFGSCSYADMNIYPLIWRCLKPGGRLFLMLFNKRYENRKTYILKRNMIKAPFHTYTEAKSTWPVLFSELHARGFNFTGDSLDWLPRSWLRKILWNEVKGLGRLWPQKALFVLVYGQKDCMMCQHSQKGIVKAMCVQCHRASIGVGSAKTQL
jgi:SAM-dependent methyltransferase